MAVDLREFEKRITAKGFRLIAGVDEAGRGPLAGPVVAAAVVLPREFKGIGITDSKKLTPKKRETLFDEIDARAVTVGIGIVDAPEIDRINILQASLKAMAMAVNDLSPQPDYLLIDGKFSIPSEIPREPIVRGDARSLSVAAASIVAKVTRDRIMHQYHKKFPEFGFDRHKGYPTKAHKEAIRQHGCCPIHRRTFKGVKEHCPDHDGS